MHMWSGIKSLENLASGTASCHREKKLLLAKYSEKDNPACEFVLQIIAKFMFINEKALILFPLYHTFSIALSLESSSGATTKKHPPEMGAGGRHLE